ncbi:hypothetical protein acsn021_05560 [Anaerocolumna cellulosilytica]|uniref:YvlB/LiaX N-terminal domain-containing protein n=1 Tax=Anaerocolumna cellulosilytica TaxID=433286 RepID=A0A6S6QYN3_9FIRM|nr:hypothetical protein [Anaerocolumna cellulosilytica]MBB5195677.1 hypothetical protein [Anaerocolumna cellulosilytica]BCJ92987.1 hypothetical protein acsn021_05560 [Anaerocolumna cellulosilytica]
MSEQHKILEMIEKGQISAVEGMELLEALKGTNETEQEINHNSAQTAVVSSRKKYKYLKVKVTSDNNSVNVNVNVPIKLISAVGSVAGRLQTMIPEDARRQMESKGININDIDFGKIIEEVLNGTIEDPNIVDVEVWDDSHNTTVKVKIYVE